MTQTPYEEVLAFLLGEGPLDGVWFGDKHPTERGAFWWRKNLRALLSPPVPTEPTEEEVMRVIDQNWWPVPGRIPRISLALQQLYRSRRDGR